jgi:hypothetical protein
MTDFEDLLSQIEAAFPSTIPADAIRQITDDMDHDTIFYVRKLLQVQWRDLPRRMVAEHSDCALTLSVERYSFVLPAYLHAYVYYLWHEDPYSGAIQSVFPYICWRNTTSSLHSLLNSIQRDVVSRCLLAGIEMHEAWGMPPTDFSPDPVGTLKEIFEVWTAK